MKSMKSLLLTGAVAATIAGSANAAVMPVAGVNIDTDVANNGFASSRIFENNVSQVGDILEGHGVVDKITSNGNVIWSAGDNNVELTFVFDYEVSAITPTGAEFINGSVTFYTQDATTSGFDWADRAASMDGVEWLNLEGHTIGGVDLSGSGSVFGGMFSGSAIGYLDVVAGAGAANTYFDTNGVATQAGNADASFNGNYDEISANGNPNFGLGGTAHLAFNTAVPEPASFALLALGGLFIGKRRK